MCLTPKTTTYTYTPVQTEPVKTPTYADASVQKAGDTARRQARGLSDATIKTSVLGLGDSPTVKKTKLGE